MTPARINYKIYQGSTFREIFRWESQTKQYANITTISKAAPCVITAPNHTVPVNWRIRVTGVTGMKEINSTGTDSYYLATAVDTNTITINQINSSGFSNYTSGGIVEWNAPVPITGYSAQMQIRETIDSTTTIAELTSTNGGILINPTEYTIIINIPASTTRQFSFPTAVYSLELTDPNGVVTTFLTGSMTLVPEITR